MRLKGRIISRITEAALDCFALLILPGIAALWIPILANLLGELGHPTDFINWAAIAYSLLAIVSGIAAQQTVALFREILSARKASRS